MVATVLGALSAGDAIEDLLEDYPTITEEDIRAALSFGGELARYEESRYEDLTG